MRSIRCVRRRLNDSSIWRMPASRPLVQTLVARNRCSRTPSSATRSPTTLSDLPYMGDESMTLPPKRTNSRNTSLSGSREDCPAPTSKVCQVPRPTASKDSPVFGIGLRMLESAMANSPVSAKVPAPSATLTNSRRDIGLAREKFNSVIAGCSSFLLALEIRRSALLSQHRSYTHIVLRLPSSLFDARYTAPVAGHPKFGQTAEHAERNCQRHDEIPKILAIA